MDRKRAQRYAELKVGIFVIVGLTILALAIFTIGTQVGFFEPTFTAKTYLSTVSGLKPGDIVLLAGVEAGNVMAVEVSKAGELPSTQANLRNLQRIQEQENRLQQLEADLADNQSKLTRIRADLQGAMQQFGPESRQAKVLERQAKNLQTVINDNTGRMEEVREDLAQARSSLQNIVVYMQIKEAYRDWIKRDSNISLGSIGLLGDKYIDVSLGRSDTPPPVVQEEVSAWFGAQTRDVLVITGTQQAGFQELITGADDVIANFEVLSRKLQTIMDRFEHGEGTVGKFFADPSFYNNLNEAVEGAKESLDQATVLMKDITRGPGTMPRLVQEREVYDKITAAVTRLESVMARIDQGAGTFGRFVNDPSLYEKSDQVMRNISDITGRMEAGQGTLGKLSTDDRLYEDLRRATDQLVRFIDNIEQGKGTLGKLARDDSLYQNLSQVSAEMMKLIYDFRQNPKKFLTINFKLF